jgi:hypothetical protein
MPGKETVSVEPIASAIRLLRGQRVLMDSDLAALYGVETKALKRAVKRNLIRFPADFMFVLTPQEVAGLRRQFGTLKKRGEHSKYLPYAFTEQGVAMLSSVLQSERAVLVNIAIMRAFVKLRETLAAHYELARRLDELEQKFAGHDENIAALFDAMRQLMEPPATSRKAIGFGVQENRGDYSVDRRQPLRTGGTSAKSGDEKFEFKVMPWLRALRDRSAREQEGVSAEERIRRSSEVSAPLMQESRRNHPDAVRSHVALAAGKRGRKA